MSDCQYELRCLNSVNCYRCHDQQLLKLPTDKQRQKSTPTQKRYTKQQRAGDDSWRNLEQDVADALNRVPTLKEARRSRASGALWFEKGDIVDEILHPESKERKGRELSGGGRSMAIQKDWLDKAREEAYVSGKIMCLPFAFKEDEQRYIIFEQENITELVCYYKSAIEEVKQLEAENEILRTRLKQQEGV